MALILVVDPDPRTGERLRDALAGAGRRIEVATGADAARELAAREAPDLWLVSVGVPGAAELLSTNSRSFGGNGSLVLLPGDGAVGEGNPASLGADGAVPRTADEGTLRAVVDQALAQAVFDLDAPAAQAAPASKLTSVDIFGDLVAEVEGQIGRPGAPAAAAPQAASPAAPPETRAPDAPVPRATPEPPASPAPPPAAAPPPTPAPPRAAEAPPGPRALDAQIERRLEQTLSGVLGTRPPKARPPQPPASPTPRETAAPSPGKRSRPASARSSSSSREVDDLLQRTLGDLGSRRRPGPPKAPPGAAPTGTPPDTPPGTAPGNATAAGPPEADPPASVPGAAEAPAPSTAAPSAGPPPTATTPTAPTAPSTPEEPPRPGTETSTEPASTEQASTEPASTEEAGTEQAGTEHGPGPGAAPGAGVGPAGTEVTVDDLALAELRKMIQARKEKEQEETPETPETAEPFDPPTSYTEPEYSVSEYGVPYDEAPEDLELGLPVTGHPGDEPLDDDGGAGSGLDPWESTPPVFGPGGSDEVAPSSAVRPPTDATSGPGTAFLDPASPPEPFVLDPVEESPPVAAASEPTPSTSGGAAAPVGGGRPSADGGEDDRFFGQYRLLERIGIGGMAEVWKARMQGLEGFQKTVAIKRILPHLTDSTDFVQMFVDEAKLAAQLSHNNIIHIYDLGKMGDDYYIAMEYVDGKHLRDTLNAARDQGRPLPVGLALYISARLASALDHAHHQRDFEGRELGLVHRDVSPQNVLISYEGDIKLCDFGIVKAVSKSSHTQMGALKGKLQYMSPEQAWGQNVDGRSDIFSLGALLFEMLTGRRLFVGDTEVQVLEAVRECRIQAPGKADSRIPPEVDQVVLKALARSPSDRFQTAGEVCQHLEEILFRLRPTPGPGELAAYMNALFKGGPFPAPATRPEADEPSGQRLVAEETDQTLALPLTGEPGGSAAPEASPALADFEPVAPPPEAGFGEEAAIPPATGISSPPFELEGLEPAALETSSPGTPAPEPLALEGTAREQPPRRSSRAWWILLAVALLLAALVAVWMATRSPDEAGPAGDAPESSLSTAAPGTAEPAVAPGAGETGSTDPAPVDAAPGDPEPPETSPEP